MGAMPSYPSLAQTLTDSLHLERPPVAVCFADAVPSGVKQFTGSVPAGCRFWQEAQSGVFATVPQRSRSVRHRESTRTIWKRRRRRKRIWAMR